jgi:hypothetical protein
MNKRNDALKALGATAPITATEAPAPPTQAQPTHVVAIKPLAEDKNEVARVMLYLPPKVAKKVKEIALHQDRKAHDIYLDALDTYLKAKGFGGLTDIAVR